MRPSFRRVQWLSGLLSSNSTSKRCRIGSQKLWFTSDSRLISTSQLASTKLRQANADLPPTTKQGSQPAERPVASSLPDGTGAPTESTPKRRRKGSPRHCTITTVDPARLDSSCFLDISGATRHLIYDSAAPESRSLLDMAYTSSRGAVQLVQNPFPPDTRGFLYFHADAHNPLQSQIRFRVTRDHDAARSFSSGQDLTYGSGYTWHIPLVNAAKSPTLREMLLRDGLVDDALLVQLQARSGVGKRLKRVMNTLGHPFTMEFNKKELHVVVRVAGQERAYETRGPLASQESVFYEEGSALCRLERSTLPQHAGRRIVVMRMLKILHSPKRCPELAPMDGVSVPAEGELFKSWCRDVDRPGKCGETLRLLYDAPDSIKQASDWSS